MDPRESYSVDDEEARFRHRHQALLQQYLGLQKEFVSSKRKLQEAKQKRETLLDEVRFLRQRRKLLLRAQSQTYFPEQEHSHLQKVDRGRKMEAKEKFYSITEVVLDNPSISSDPIWTSDIEEQNGGKDAPLESLRIGKKRKDAFSGGKRMDKKKISWQDQVALRV